MAGNLKRTICLFDIDGTLTPARQSITSKMSSSLEKLSKICSVGLVSGSDIEKLAEQMNGMENLLKYDYVFAENGLVAYKDENLFSSESMLKYMGEEKLQRFINFCLRYLSEIELPSKRGTFIEFRTGMINICPVGRSCSRHEREEFCQYDQIHGVRNKMVDALRTEFQNYGLHFSIGGQISIDAFPEGWDKTYCLRHLNEFEVIHFFGDKVEEGGNDYEIFSHNRTLGHKVTCPEDTERQLCQIFKLQL